MLLERIIPGTMLKDESSLTKRLFVFTELFNGLHIAPKNPKKSMSYFKVMCDAMEVVKNREDAAELYTHALKAKDILFEMSSIYNKKVLLHWDLKNDNIPFGFISDPVLEIGRFISKECSDAVSGNRLETVDKITDYFDTNLKIPKKILQQCFYIDVVLMKCLIVQLGGTACMYDEKFDVKFAANVLNDN
jgi:streptomycin 6-kinase